MPTGYTAKLMESGQTFQDFVMQCARAFGACVMMRDDPMDAPIPERFEPSDYNVKRLAEAKAELVKLQAMTNDEKIAFGESKKAESIASSASVASLPRVNGAKPSRARISRST